MPARLDADALGAVLPDASLTLCDAGLVERINHREEIQLRGILYDHLRGFVVQALRDFEPGLVELIAQRLDHHRETQDPFGNAALVLPFNLPIDIHQFVIEDAGYALDCPDVVLAGWVVWELGAERRAKAMTMNVHDTHRVLIACGHAKFSLKRIVTLT